jgi:hypothetical protein
MAWPKGRGAGNDRCPNNATEVGHGIFLCIDCQETALVDLKKRAKERVEADKQIAQLAQHEAGQAPIHDPIYWGRGEVSGGRMEENRRKH